MKVLYVHMQPWKTTSLNLEFYRHRVNSLKAYDIHCGFLLPDIGGSKDCKFPIHKYSFYDYRLDTDTKSFILGFKPDVVHLASPRFQSIRVALEAIVLTNAPLIVTHEDDEIFIATRDTMPLSGKEQFLSGEVPTLTPETLETLFNGVSWPFVLQEWLGPATHQLAEPLSYALINHLAVGMGGIWDNVITYLHRTFGKPTCLMPPAIPVSEYSCGPASKTEKRIAEEKFGLPSNQLILLFSGSNYSLMHDFDILLHALGQDSLRHSEPLWHLCVTGTDGAKTRHVELAERLHIDNRISWLGFLDEKDLRLVNKRADIALSPGLHNRFNQLRLPSKNVRYMAHGLPLVTFSCGFGESLTDGKNAILTYTDQPAEWAEKIRKLVDNGRLRKELGRNARAFAERRLDCDAVAPQIAQFYENIANQYSETAILRRQIPSQHKPDLSSALLRLQNDKRFSRCKKLAIYGAGKHTRRLLSSPQFKYNEQELIIVDDAPQVDELNGIRVFGSSKIHEWQPDGILISSDAFENQLYDKAIKLATDETFIFRLYDLPVFQQSKRRRCPPWTDELPAGGSCDHRLLVDPNKIRYTINANNEALRGSGNIGIGMVVDGDQDMNGHLIKTYHIYTTLMKRVQGFAYEKIPVYQADLARIKQGVRIDNCTSVKEFRKRVETTERLYWTIKNDGYKTQKELGSAHPNNEIRIQIGRTGGLLFEEGLHRLVVAQVLGIKQVPVIVSIRHKQWNDLREAIVKIVKARGFFHQPFDHPDLDNIPQLYGNHLKDQAMYGHDRWEFIIKSLPLAKGTVLDIGAYFGYFCHRFENLGFDCTAVEMDSLNLDVLKQYRSMAGKRFKIVEKSIFDVKDYHYDIVLALNIFHHLVKTKENVDRLQNFLGNLQCSAMYFEPGQNKQPDSYLSLADKQFIKFVLDNSVFNRSVFLGRAKERRNVYLLTR